MHRCYSDQYLNCGFPCIYSWFSRKMNLVDCKKYHIQPLHNPFSTNQFFAWNKFKSNWWLWFDVYHDHYRDCWWAFFKKTYSQAIGFNHNRRKSDRIDWEGEVRWLKRNFKIFWCRIGGFPFKWFPKWDQSDPENQPMFFTSFNFFLFFPCVVILYYLIPHRFQWLLLLIASSLFYAVFSWGYLLFLFVVILLNFVIGLNIYLPDGKLNRPVYLSGILINILILCFYKYFIPPGFANDLRVISWLIVQPLRGCWVEVAPLSPHFIWGY